MNEANVAALAKLIAEVGWADAVYPAIRDLAERLSARGVLVPSALTDDQCHCIADEGLGFPSRLRAALGRIARGDGFQGQPLERLAKGEP